MVSKSSLSGGSEALIAHLDQKSILNKDIRAELLGRSSKERREKGSRCFPAGSLPPGSEALAN